MNEEIYNWLKTTFLWDQNWDVEGIICMLKANNSERLVMRLAYGISEDECERRVLNRYFRGKMSEYIFLFPFSKSDNENLMNWLIKQPLHNRIQDLVENNRGFTWEQLSKNEMDTNDIQELKDLIKSIQQPEPIKVIETVVDTALVDYWKQRTLLAESFLNAGSKNRAERRKAYRDFIAKTAPPIETHATESGK
jgi:hypothetical protein